jgi:hypothetical protein
MRLPEKTSSQDLPSALLGSYMAELNRWAGKIAMGYALATALLVAGAFSIAVALSIGGAAVFHRLEAHYGPYVAYGTLGSLFLLGGIASLAVGLRMLGQPIPPAPRPRRLARAIKRAIAGPAVARALTTGHAGRGTRPDNVTQALAGAAAVALLGWIAASYAPRSSLVDREAK